MPAGEVEGSTMTGTAWVRPSTDKAPKMQFDPTSYGFRYAAIRKPIRSPETNQYVRTTLFLAPFTVLIPPNDQYKLSQMLVPMDDVNTMFYWVAWHPDPKKGIGQAEWRKFCAAEVCIDLDSSYRKKRNSENGYLQDREAMKRGDFTGITGIPTQDMAMWESMGPITDRSQDNPGASDLAVAQFRRLMVAAAKSLRRRRGDRRRQGHALRRPRLVRGRGAEDDGSAASACARAKRSLRNSGVAPVVEGGGARPV
jgi:phthalate 4,5-dioxygenase oxygenase subunit